MFLKPITMFSTVHRVFYCAPPTQGSTISHVRAFLNAQAGHVFETHYFYGICNQKWLQSATLCQFKPEVPHKWHAVCLQCVPLT